MIHDHGFYWYYWVVLHLLEAAGLVRHCYALMNIKSPSQEPYPDRVGRLSSRILICLKPTTDRYDLVPTELEYQSGNQELETILAFLRMPPSDSAGESVLPIPLLIRDSDLHGRTRDHNRSH